MNGPRIIALSGGVGGAKLADGLYRALPPEMLGVLVNTGDDFVHLGLSISPDIDTVVYTLAGVANMAQGWGLADESWAFMDTLKKLGGPDWFKLGDRDLAMHVWRSHALAAGSTLSAVTADAVRAHGIAADIWPMCDRPVATIIDSDIGVLAFQDYFVARRCAPVVQGIRYADAGDAVAAEGFRASLRAPGLGAIIVCPSNPWLSIDPILAIPGMRAAIRSAGVPVIAVSPLVEGRAVKGPTAKIMAELGLPVTTAAIAAHYAGLIDGIVIDSADDVGMLSLPVHRTATMMTTIADRIRLARETMSFASRLATAA